MVKFSQYVTKAKTMTLAIINGHIFVQSSSNFTFVIAETLYKHNPTGGVINPIIKLYAIIIPNWTGSMPKELQIGNSTGTSIIIAAVPSITQPIKSKIKFKDKRIIKGLSEIFKIKLAIC